MITSSVVYVFHMGVISEVLCDYEVQMNTVLIHWAKAVLQWLMLPYASITKYYICIVVR